MTTIKPHNRRPACVTPPTRAMRHVRNVYGDALYAAPGIVGVWIGTLAHADRLGIARSALTPHLDTVGPFVGD